MIGGGLFRIVTGHQLPSFIFDPIVNHSLNAAIVKFLADFFQPLNLSPNYCYLLRRQHHTTLSALFVRNPTPEGYEVIPVPEPIRHATRSSETHEF